MFCRKMVANLKQLRFAKKGTNICKNWGMDDHVKKIIVDPTDSYLIERYYRKNKIF